MQKRSTRTRKVKRVIVWGPTLWLLFVITTIVGLIYSPMTAVHVVRVEGCSIIDQARIRKILHAVKDVPFLKVASTKVESLVLNNPEFENAEFRHNIFGRAALLITPRSQIAQLLNQPSVALAKDGTFFKTSKILPNLSTVRLPEANDFINATIIGTSESKAIASLMINLLSLLKGRVLDLEQDARGMICVTVNKESKIIFGSSSDLNNKLQKLTNSLKKSPAMLDAMREFNLTVPKNPVYIPKTTSNEQAD